MSQRPRGKNWKNNQKIVMDEKKVHNVVMDEKLVHTIVMDEELVHKIVMDGCCKIRRS